MNDDRVTQLETEVNDLKQRLHQHEEMRSGAFDALAAVQSRMEKLVQRMPVTAPPEVQAEREGGMLQQYAILATRLRAVEEWLREMSPIVLENHEMLKEWLILLKNGGPEE
jgi:hypothetical protein